ncbi:MAG TPA: ribonuclease Y [Anaerolineae bacterium]|jgi:ribonuclease Y|nr:ribonuclease Y [Anaerolineae bacterium]
MEAVVIGLGLLGCILVGFALGYVLRQYLGTSKIKSAQEEAERIVSEAETKRKEMFLEVKTEALSARREGEEELKQRRRQVRNQEERLQKRQEALERRVEPLEQRERQLSAQESRLKEKESELEDTKRKRIEELQAISRLSQEEAKQLLLQAVEGESRQEMARVIREVEQEARETADRQARKIISDAIQRYSSDAVAEITVSTVDLPSDELKGRIIGRGGRNIRALENAAGVDLIVDDTPEAVTISSFDPVRREVARLALTKLIMDGRIHPGRIEEVVAKARREVESIIQEEGERAVFDVGLSGMHPELVKLLGRLKYRTSYGQNQLEHALQTAHLAGMMAAELGADVKLAKEGGLLHDIGKAADHEVEGPHAMIGGDIGRRYGKSPVMVNIIASHHGEEEPQTVEAVLVASADAISGARPGARRESLETYVKRIKALEEVASSFQGIGECYAIQAGREIRIVVRPEQIDDLGILRLSKDVARKVEESLAYPGQIKVTVIRETRAVDYAK